MRRYFKHEEPSPSDGCIRIRLSAATNDRAEELADFIVACLGENSINLKTKEIYPCSPPYDDQNRVYLTFDDL